MAKQGHDANNGNARTNVARASNRRADVQGSRSIPVELLHGNLQLQRNRMEMRRGMLPMPETQPRKGKRFTVRKPMQQ